jgi:hypothetical protein
LAINNILNYIHILQKNILQQQEEEGRQKGARHPNPLGWRMANEKANVKSTKIRVS